jgi:hypothetical protein
MGQHQEDDRVSMERGDDRGPEGRISVLERQRTLTLDQENGNGRVRTHRHAHGQPEAKQPQEP